MKAMILAAGQGTRLAPLTDRIPKPMLPIQGKPLIHWQLEQLRRAGVTEVVINLHHLGEQIADFVGDGSAFGASVQFSRETALLETGGGIVNALPLLGNAPFVLLNGDIFTSFDFTTLAPGPGPAHLVLTPTPAHRTHGDFQFDGTRIHARGDDFVYCGIAVLKPELFAGAPKGPFSWTADLLFERLGDTEVTGQVFAGAWTDIGTIEQYEAVR